MEPKFPFLVYSLDMFNCLSVCFIPCICQNYRGSGWRRRGEQVVDRIVFWACTPSCRGGAGSPSYPYIAEHAQASLPRRSHWEDCSAGQVPVAALDLSCLWSSLQDRVQKGCCNFRYCQLSIYILRHTKFILASLCLICGSSKKKRAHVKEVRDKTVL